MYTDLGTGVGLWGAHPCISLQDALSYGSSGVALNADLTIIYDSSHPPVGTQGQPEGGWGAYLLSVLEANVTSRMLQF